MVFDKYDDGFVDKNVKAVLSHHAKKVPFEIDIMLDGFELNHVKVSDAFIHSILGFLYNNCMDETLWKLSSKRCDEKCDFGEAGREKKLP